MAPNFLERRRIAQDTVERTPSVIASTPGASAASAFYDERSCPALNSTEDAPQPAHPHRGPSRVTVLNADSFAACYWTMTVSRGADEEDEDEEDRDHNGRKIAVLNLASDEQPAGGWLRSLSKTQEEALCYSSTLYATLRPEWYPWPNLGPGSVAGIYSPAVVVFKDDLDHGCAEFAAADRTVVAVITVAAPRAPALTADKTALRNASDIEDLRGKIRLVLRMAARDGRDTLVLGAMGCGAYGCPPLFVAEEMKAIILEEEFKGWFREIIFAVYSATTVGPSNYKTFHQVFQGLEINH